MSREVMQQSLEALEWFVKNDDTVIGMKGNEFWEAGLNRGIDTVAVLRKELAKPDHIPDARKMVGPVACLTEVEGMTMVWPIADYAEAVTYCDEGENPVLLYAAPPQRQLLTDEECIEAIDASFEFALASGNVSNASVIRYARVIEAKTKEQS